MDGDELRASRVRVISQIEHIFYNILCYCLPFIYLIPPFWLIVIITFIIALCIPILTSPMFLIFRLIFGTLYPAYSSYKAVKNKNVREYLKWMMYWIVFALFSSVETLADFFVAFWCPFYYEIKIIFLLWLVSPVSDSCLGSSILYRKFVHPNLSKKEKEIDRMIEQAKQRGYDTILRLGSRTFQCISQFVMQNALKGNISRNDCKLSEIVGYSEEFCGDQTSQIETKEMIKDCNFVPPRRLGWMAEENINLQSGWRSLPRKPRSPLFTKNEKTANYAECKKNVRQQTLRRGSSSSNLLHYPSSFINISDSQYASSYAKLSNTRQKLSSSMLHIYKDSQSVPKSKKRMIRSKSTINVNQRKTLCCDPTSPTFNDKNIFNS